MTTWQKAWMVAVVGALLAAVVVTRTSAQHDGGQDLQPISSLVPPASMKETGPCPWDCGGDNDANVGIVDFLGLLAQWGGPGPCDFDGGGVGIVDFLELLGNWGPCPLTTCAPACDPFGTLSELGNPALETAVEFGSIDIPPIPADFFFPGSDPFVGRAPLVGFLKDPDNLGMTDTIVCRSGPVDFPGAGFPRPSDPVAIEIVELSLTGAEPITVNGPQPEQWLVAMGLAPNQQQGQLNAVIESPDGGQTTAQIPVKPLLAFARLDDVIALQKGQIPPEQVNIRILDWDSEGLPPVDMGWSSPFPFSTVPPADGSFFCFEELENPFPFFPGVPPGGAPHGSPEAPGLPPHIAAGGPGHLHFVCPPPPPPPGLCTYTLLVSIGFGCVGGCPAPAVGKIPLPCPIGGPPPCPPGPAPIGCPPLILVAFACPGGGFCVGIYIAAACCTC